LVKGLGFRAYVCALKTIVAVTRAEKCIAEEGIAEECIAEEGIAVIS